MRNRKEDIVLLANAFLKEFNQENGKQIGAISSEAFNLIQHYDWPGNVRELRTAIEHGVVMCNGLSIEPNHLPLNIQLGAPLIQTINSPSIATDGPVARSTTQFNLQTLESGTIRQALKHTNSNRTAAAELLGISRRTLQRKLKELDAYSQ